MDSRDIVAVYIYIYIYISYLLVRATDLLKALLLLLLHACEAVG